MQELNTLIELSHEFGTPDYVKGGGGNTSVKNPTTMWIKPSGTTLAGLSRETLVAMNRAQIDRLYQEETPADPAAREELVKNLMADAVENGGGRPSVEAPLHNVFGATYVVHTHAVLVNGLTCAKDGEAVCNRLFHDALWVEYIDPGYTLCMAVRHRMRTFKEARGHEPALVMLQNHGIFVAGNSPDEIRALYARVMEALETEYLAAGIARSLDPVESLSAPETETAIQQVFGEDAAYIAAAGPFDVAPGPITPDHMVYSRAVPYSGPLTTEGAESYRAEHGFPPKLVITGGQVYGIGTSQKNADLAVELAQDGALVMHLAEAFGGIQYMTGAQREFIENWEVESYRQQQV